MKVTHAILLLAIAGSFSAHADLAPGTMNCQAALDGDTANKQVQANLRVAQVEGKAAPTPAPAQPQSSSKTTK